MCLALITVALLIGYFSIRNFKLLEIDGKVTEYLSVSDFHAMPQLTIQNDEGKTWVLHNSIFKQFDVQVGDSFIKSSGSTTGFIDGNEVNLGWARD